MAKDAVITGLQQLLSMPIFVLHPQLLPLLATEGLATAKPGFLDRLIHAEATTAHLPLVTFEKATAHQSPIPHDRVGRSPLRDRPPIPDPFTAAP